MKNIPAAINQICHINITPSIVLLYNKYKKKAMESEMFIYEERVPKK